MRPQFAYLRGEFVPSDQACINIQTHAFLYGTAAFEGIKAYWLPEEGRMAVFRMAEHYQRLLQSCRILRLKAELSAEQMGALTLDLVKRNGHQGPTYIRPIVYKTDLRIGPILLAPNTQDDFCLFSLPLDQYVDTRKGLHVGVSSWRRLDDNAIPARAKVNGAYVNTALAKTDAHLCGFDDALVLNQEGNIAEGSAMNLFLVRDGCLITPTVSDNILEGITRATVMELVRAELGLEVVARSIDRTELYVADEAFMVGTAAEVAPVTRFDHRPVGDGNIGALTRQIQGLYTKVVRGQLPQYDHWLARV
ncbi:branched-chain amino acid transaminase [Leptolyngbya sp. FACHB-261]|nr:branched-chain amino acid transaminase [Leptolyngbya sp. FACHB-261]